MNNEEFSNHYDDEKCECYHCLLSEEYTDIAMEAETKNELFSIVRAAFEEAYELGYKQSIYDDIQMKVQAINNIDYRDM